MASRRHHRVKQTLRAALSALALTSTPDCHSLSVEVVGEGRFPPSAPTSGASSGRPQCLSSSDRVCEDDQGSTGEDRRDAGRQGIGQGGQGWHGLR
ncbi:hypothetical protein VR43_21255 [Streptomyces sp. NRRL S-104]|nr:hypothetical protein VR43_21255 [Streptomyces sp. NRRL S-104]